MAFGQQSGPPASTKQVDYLRTLLKDHGHDDLRTARHEFGLTQRQAGGKFTVGEVTELIDRLLAASGDDEFAPDGSARTPFTDPAAERRAVRAAEALLQTRVTTLQGMPAELMAEELERRGWILIPAG